MRIRVRGSMVCSNCGRIMLSGEEAVNNADTICCLACSIDILLERIERLEQRIEELEIRNGIAVRL